VDQRKRTLRARKVNCLFNVYHWCEVSNALSREQFQITKIGILATVMVLAFHIWVHTLI